MPIIAYMVGADFLANGVAAQVETLKKEVEIAATLGAHLHAARRYRRQGRHR